MSWCSLGARVIVRGRPHGRNQETRRDPGRGCRRIQPPRRRGRGSHAIAASGAPQRSDRSRDCRESWTSREAHRRWCPRGVPQRSRLGALCHRGAIWNDRAQRGLPPERRIEFRIGIHLGDVVEESDGDLMGDGINIAARLEGIAEPGAICLSEDAFRQVRARLDLAVKDLGETQLKNIAHPIRVYSLQVGVPAETTPAPPAQEKVLPGPRCLTTRRSPCWRSRT